MLLPLPITKVRALSLANYLALAAMHSGHGNLDQMVVLLRSLYLAHLMLEPDEVVKYAPMFQEAEAALERCITRAEQRRG